MKTRDVVYALILALQEAEKPGGKMRLTKDEQIEAWKLAFKHANTGTLDEKTQKPRFEELYVKAVGKRRLKNEM